MQRRKACKEGMMEQSIPKNGTHAQVKVDHTNKHFTLLGFTVLIGLEHIDSYEAFDRSNRKSSFLLLLVGNQLLFKHSFFQYTLR